MEECAFICVNVMCMFGEKLGNGRPWLRYLVPRYWNDYELVSYKGHTCAAMISGILIIELQKKEFKSYVLFHKLNAEPLCNSQ